MKIKITRNPKLSLEPFAKEELKMIREIKKAGYIIKFNIDNDGAELLEPYKSCITGKKYNKSIASTSKLRAWGSKTYPLELWYKLVIKQ